MIIQRLHKSESREKVVHVSTLALIQTCTCESYVHSGAPADADGEIPNDPPKECKHTRADLALLEKVLRRTRTRT